MTESKQAKRIWSVATLIASTPDLLAENERLRSEVEELKATRATLLGEAVKAGVQLAELREALETVSNWSGDFTTGESVYDYAGAALADNDRLRSQLAELREAAQDGLMALEAHLDESTRDHGLGNRDMLCPCNKNEVAALRAALKRTEGGE